MTNAIWQWPHFQNIFQSIKVPPGYVLATLDKKEISPLISKIQLWYPEVTTSRENAHLNEKFYFENSFLSDSTDHEKNILPVVLKHQDEIVALVTFEKHPTAQNLSSRIGTVDPKHRGSGIAFIGPLLLETLGKKMNAGLIYYYATLKIPHQQAVAEKMGFSLVGIMPAFDKELTKDGSIKRAYEAMYAKVLCEDTEIEIPNEEALTPKTKELYNMIFCNKKSES